MLYCTKYIFVEFYVRDSFVISMDVVKNSTYLKYQSVRKDRLNVSNCTFIRVLLKKSYVRSEREFSAYQMSKHILCIRDFFSVFG